MLHHTHTETVCSISYATKDTNHFQCQLNSLYLQTTYTFLCSFPNSTTCTVIPPSHCIHYHIYLLLKAVASPHPPQVGCCPATNPVLYYKVMTPQWLQDHASLNHLIAASPTSLHFRPNQQSARMIKVPLFQRGELPTDDITVTITVHLEDPPTSDSDFVAAICDGTVCNGLYISDSGNYPNHACNYLTMNSGVVRTSITSLGNCGGIRITYTTFPNTVTITFYPIHKWASFSIPPSGGYTTAGTFTRQLDLTKGLYLEAYGDNANEQYKLQFMEVKVTKN